MAIFRPLDLAILVCGAVVTAFFSLRLSLSTSMLEGLKMYIPASGSGGTTDASTSNKKKDKSKATIGGDKDDIDLGGAETLFVIPVSRAHVQTSPFFQVVETLIYAIQLAIFTAVAYPAAHKYASIGFYSTPLAMSTAVLGIALSSLVRVDLISVYTSASDKIYAGMFAVLGFLVAAATFAVGPEGAFAWDAADASSAARSLMQSLAGRSMPNATLEELQALSSIAPSPLGIQLLFSVFGAALAALLFAPTLRFIRAYMMHQSPPDWAAGHLEKSSVLSTARLHFHLMLPVVCALLWIRPLVQDPLGLTDRQIAIARAGCATFTGLLMISNCKILMGRYLETSLTAWYSLKHGAKRTSSGRTAAGVLIQAKASAVRTLMCRAAVQSIAPGVVLLCCGLALGGFLLPYSEFSSGFSGSEYRVGEQAAAAAAVGGGGGIGSGGAGVVVNSGVAPELSRLVNNIAGFLIWWTGSVWFIFTALILWLFRTGTIPN